jgi:hypothetical protein
MYTSSLLRGSFPALLLVKSDFFLLASSATCEVNSKAANEVKIVAISAQFSTGKSIMILLPLHIRINDLRISEKEVCCGR